MNTYKVGVPETVYRMWWYAVEAETPEEAEGVGKRMALNSDPRDPYSQSELVDLWEEGEWEGDVEVSK